MEVVEVGLLFPPLSGFPSSNAAPGAAGSFISFTLLYERRHLKGRDQDPVPWRKLNPYWRMWPGRREPRARGPDPNWPVGAKDVEQRAEFAAHQSGSELGLPREAAAAAVPVVGRFSAAVRSSSGSSMAAAVPGAVLPAVPVVGEAVAVEVRPGGLGPPPP